MIQEKIEINNEKTPFTTVSISKIIFTKQALSSKYLSAFIA